MLFCDDVYVNDGMSTDGTRDILYTLQQEYGKDRLKIFEREWVHTKKFWAEQRNYILDQIPSSNFIINVGADEIFPDEDLPKIRRFVDEGNHETSLVFRAVHFYGRPTHAIEGPDWAVWLTKLWSNRTGIRYINRQGGCADDPCWPNGQPAHWVNRKDYGVRVYHYGHCRDPKAVGIKNKKASMLYQGKTDLADGSLPEISTYDYRFDELLAKGALKEFTGKHPEVMKGWVEKHINQETFWRG